jgi:hypothetical protein
MNPITIQCTRCSTCLLLGSEIQSRIRGRTGRLPCNGCGEKIRLDGRAPELEFTGARRIELATLELDEAPSARGEQLSLLPPPPDLMDEPAEEAQRPRSLAPRLHALHPPRPSGAPRPPLPSNPFDELGSLAPVVPLQGVRLTADGRLVNRTDEAPASKRSRMRTWAPLAAAGLLATGFASAKVSSMLPLGRSAPPDVKHVASSVLEPGAVAASSPHTALSIPSEARLLDASEPTQALDAKTAEVVATPTKPSPTKVDEPSLRAPSSAPDAPDAEGSTEREAAVLTPSSETAPLKVAPDGMSKEPSGESSETGDTANGTPEFSRDAAMIALQHVAADAMGCRQAGDPAGSARVVVTFAPSGRVTTANVGGVYAGTLTGGCIAGRFRAATVPAFAGSHVTVSKTISVE